MTQNIRDEFKKHINYEQGEAEDEYLMTLADWWIDKLNTTLKEIEEKIEKSAVRCVGLKRRDDGVHIDFKCPDCKQEWGEEEKTPICKKQVIYLYDIKQLINQKLIK